MPPLTNVPHEAIRKMASACVLVLCLHHVPFGVGHINKINNGLNLHPLVKMTTTAAIADGDLMHCYTHTCTVLISK